MKINYAQYAFDVYNLGPGKRSVLWVQGCPFECPGCISPNHRGEGGYFEESNILARMFLNCSDSGEITISGGEPILQASALCEFIDALKNERDIGVIMYSGFEYSQIKKMADENPGIRELLGKIDLLIDGKYVAELDRKEILRGSINQQFIYLTDRYTNIEESEYSKLDRSMEIRFEKNRMMMIGIPDETQAKQWDAAKRTLRGVIDELKQ